MKNEVEILAYSHIVFKILLISLTPNKHVDIYIFIHVIFNLVHFAFLIMIQYEHNMR